MNRLQHIGLGLRQDFIDDFLKSDFCPAFIEVAPENWMSFPEYKLKKLEQCVEKSPLVCHGLSLSIGGIKPLNREFIQQVKAFLTRFNVSIYSEHLSYCDDGGYLYDLLPIPMTQEAVRYVAERIMQVQDILGQRLVLENVSTYLMPGAQMSEAEFISEVIALADCELLLDINNVYVNSVNHGSDAKQFIQKMPPEKIRYLHIAGHDVVNDSLVIDTHGQAVTDAVWDLLDYGYQQFGLRSTLLERDFNIPSWQDMELEMLKIQEHQQQYVLQAKNTYLYITS